MLRSGAAHHNICSNCQIRFYKVQRTEISLAKGYGALHLREFAYLFFYKY
jgi:hypothetical protein